MSPKVTALDKQIAKCIRALRDERKLTQPAVAGVLKVSYQSYQKMESGTVSFRASTLDKLATLFGVPVATLFGGAGGKALRNAEEVAHVTVSMQGMGPDAAKGMLAHALTLKAAIGRAVHDGR